MWNEDKQRRLDDLRRRETLEVLSIDEQELLDQLLHEVEEAESTELESALDHLRAEQRDIQAAISRLEQQNATLADLASQYEDLLRRARAQFAGIMRSLEEPLHSGHARVWAREYALATRAGRPLVRLACRTTA